MFPPSEKPRATLAMLVSDGQLLARVVVSSEPTLTGFRFRACEWQLFDGDLIVRSGIQDGLPAAVKSVELVRQVWNQKLTEEQRETARKNARGRTDAKDEQVQGSQSERTAQ
jgi:hypothetical protein